MVKLSISMMGWGWKYHLHCYLQQKKSSSIFSKKDFLNRCNYIVWNKKKLNTAFSSICPTSHLMLENFPRSILWESIILFLWWIHHWQKPFRILAFWIISAQLRWLIIGINFHAFSRSTPLMKTLKDFIFILFSYGKCICTYSSSNNALYLSSRFCSL